MFHTSIPETSLLFNIAHYFFDLVLVMDSMVHSEKDTKEVLNNSSIAVSYIYKYAIKIISKNS